MFKEKEYDNGNSPARGVGERGRIIVLGSIERDRDKYKEGNISLILYLCPHLQTLLWSLSWGPSFPFLYLACKGYSKRCVQGYVQAQLSLKWGVCPRGMSKSNSQVGVTKGCI